MSERYSGVVFNFDPSRAFGFVSVDGRPDTSSNRLFFHLRDAIPDAINRRGIPEGSPVSFEITGGRNGSEMAVQVRNEDPTLDQIDLTTYAEFGQVRTWNGSWGYLRRPDGDGLRFAAKNVISEGIETIQVGT